MWLGRWGDFRVPVCVVCFMVARVLVDQMGLKYGLNAWFALDDVCGSGCKLWGSC